MLIYFVRHGIIQGHKDTKLNDAGREEARLLGQALKDVEFDEAHSSSLSRARETAEILVQSHPNLSLSLEPGLMERGLGSLEGNRWVKGYKLPDDAEPSSEFQQRIYKWFSRFLQTHASTEKDSHNASGPTILIVSHGAFLSTLFSILISSAVSFTLAEGVDRSRSCRNTSIMKVKCWEERGEWKGEVLSWGHVPHLVEEGKVVSVADDLSKAE